MGSVVMGGGLMDLLIRPMKCPGRPCLIGGGYLNRYPTLVVRLRGLIGIFGSEAFLSLRFTVAEGLQTRDTGILRALGFRVSRSVKGLEFS